MKVLFFQPYLANWRIQFLEYFISKSDMDVLVYDGGFSSKNDKKSVTGNNAPFDVHKLFSLSPVIKISGQEYPFYFSPFLIFRLIKDRPDVIVTEGEINFINNISILVYSKLFGKRYVWWSLGKVRTRSRNIVNKVLDPVVDYILNRASCIMARNSYARDYYINNKGVDPQKVIVAPNSMNNNLVSDDIDHKLLERLERNKKGRVILYVGALVESKKPMDLLKIFSEVKFEYDDVELWFVGDGDERSKIEEKISEMGLGESVKMFGKVFKGVGTYFKASDLVAVPGLGGLVINHAMIYGKPVVSRLADGTEYDLIEDGKTGFIVGASDSELLQGIKDTLNLSGSLQVENDIRRKISDEWNIDLMVERATDCINYTRVLND